jgi:hypothetical protein
MSHLVCRGCQPEVSMLLTAGPASSNMPLGDKTGMDWARAVYADPANREGLRRARWHGRHGIRGACAQDATLSGEFYSGYDGACQYQVQVVWGPSIVELSPTGP